MAIFKQMKQMKHVRLWFGPKSDPSESLSPGLPGSIPNDNPVSFGIGKFSLTELAGIGNLEDFEEGFSKQPLALNGKDAKGRAAVHEASARGRINILQYLIRKRADLNLRDNDGNTALHYAVQASEVDVIDFLIYAGVDPSIHNERNMAAIHLAAEGGHLKSLEALLKHREVDVNIRGEQGGTPLHFCALMNVGECARLLLKSGALPNMQCDNGFYPIHVAAKSASYDTLKVLIQAAIKRGYSRNDILLFKDKENNTPLHSAVHSGSLKVVEICLKAGAPVTIQHDDDLSTPVHLACSQGNLALLRLMHDKQPDNFTRAMALRDIDNMTPLHRAATFDHVDVVDYLIEKGSNVNLEDKEHRTPLLLAATKESWDTVKCLLTHRADIRARDSHCRNFLHLSIRFGGKLKELGCTVLQGIRDNVNEQDFQGYTPLHYACREGHLLALEDLLDMGACISPKNKQKQSPFHIAARFGRLSTCKRLLDLDEGPSIINETDSNGQTALHMAAENGHTRVVSMLQQKGAVAGRDNDSNTPLHLAASNGYTQCMRLLLGVHANLLDLANNNGDTALHTAAANGHTNVVTLLMTMEAVFATNKAGMTFFDNAISCIKADVAMGIVIHERWEEAMDLPSTEYGCPMVGLVKQLPEVCMVVLERSHTMAGLDSRRNGYYVDYNFKYLRSAMGPLLAGTLGERKYTPMVELNMMVKTGRVECLAHPVCVNFLRMKWNTYGRWYCTFQLLIYLTFLSLLTAFITGHDSMDHYDIGKVDNSTLDVLHGNRKGGHYYSPAFTVILWIIEIFAALNIIKELCLILTERWRYFCDLQNLLEWILYTLVLAFITPFLMHYSIHWQWEVGAFTIWLAWFNCLVFLQRFDFFGMYVVMFIEILKTLLQVIVVFSILVIAFGLSLFVLMSHETSKAYSYPGLAMLRSVTMMLEMEYMDTYNEPYNDDDEVTLHYTHGTLFLMSIYVLFMPIILMNLLIGLAVGDIQSVLTNARLQRLTIQVNLHTDLDRKMPRELLLKLDKLTHRVYPNRSRNILRDMWSKVMRYDDELSGMAEGQTAAHNKYMYTELYKQKNRIKELSATVDKSHDILRQIAQNMDIHTEDEIWDEGRPSNQCVLNTLGRELVFNSTSLGRHMLQQSMVIARWKRYVNIGGGGGGKKGKGRGRGRR